MDEVVLETLLVLLVHPLVNVSDQHTLLDYLLRLVGVDLELMDLRLDLSEARLYELGDRLDFLKDFVFNLTGDPVEQLQWN